MASIAAHDRGRDTTSPWQMPLRGWRDVLLRTWKESSEDNLGLISAGVAFYGFLAMVPLMGAVVLSYGLIATPATVLKNMQQLTSVMPADAARLIGEQLMNLVTSAEDKKGWGLLLAMGVALYGAMQGAGSMVTAMNIVYDEDEKRGFIHTSLLALGITAGAVLLAVGAIIAIAAFSNLENLLPWAPGLVLLLGKLLSWTITAVAGAAAAATLYRYGPSRQNARWVWLTPGSAFSALAWMTLTFGFGLYVANFGNYDATYGSLGAVVVLLTWLYLSAYVLLIGAELNSELEHQTEKDSTTGPSRPRGSRGAYVADTVGQTP